MIIAQISDLHLRTDGIPIKDKVDSVAALHACIDHLNALDPRPDAVLATGDLIQQGAAVDYGPLRAILGNLHSPVFVIPGNHDDRDALRRTFAADGYLPDDGPFLHYVVDDGPLRLLALDTLVPGSIGGAMCGERLAWLEARLAEAPARPTLIFMHHPPFRTGVAFLDYTPFEGAAAMEAIVRRHPCVERVVCGHVHRDVHVRWGGTVASTAPSVVFQMAMDLRPGAPPAFRLEPAVVPVFCWDEETGLIAHRSVVGDFGPVHALAPLGKAGGRGSNGIDA